jgi:flagellar M-ring protein FliF
VITTDGRMPNQTHGQLGGAETSGVDMETAMAERVVQVLAPVVGADHVKSSVTIEYDPTSAESTQDLYDPNTAAVVTSQTSQETAQDLDSAGIPGTATNAPNTPPAGNAASQSTSGQTTQGIRSENKTFAVSHTTKHLIEPAGRFKRIAAAILVDDFITAPAADGQGTETRRKRSPQEMKQIEDLAKAALGFDATRGDQISVQNISFQSAPVEKFEGPTMIERVRVVSERWTGLLRYVALLGLFVMLYFLVLNPVKKQVLAAFESAAQPALPAGAAGPALASGATAELSSGNRASLGAAASGEPDLQRALAMRQEIVSNVKADPESAGRLVQNWLGESGTS